MRRLLLLAVALSALFSCSTRIGTASYDVIPLPGQIVPIQGPSYILTDGISICCKNGNSELRKNAAFLKRYIEEETGLELALEQPSGSPDFSGDRITLELLDSAAIPEDSYKLSVSEHQILIQSPSGQGIFHGIQTLRKALPARRVRSVALPQVEIFDHPRFEYRGMHLDIARHFFTEREIKEYIDILALHDMNYLHLHLCDNQAWRIEIKKYPRLAREGGKYNMDDPKSGRRVHRIDKPLYLTQEQMRDIIAYAESRYITVIPEIDMPGHFTSGIVAYPQYACDGVEVGPDDADLRNHHELCPGKDSTLTFAEDVLSEIMDMFPSQFVHIGGDECTYREWMNCPRCSARIAALGIQADSTASAYEKLQSWFTTQIDSFLTVHGKRMIGWDEIMRGGLSPNATVMSWRGVSAGQQAAGMGHDVIMCPEEYCYFDHYQAEDITHEPYAEIGGCTTTEKTYSFDPLAGIDTLDNVSLGHILGAQANLWTESVRSLKHAEYMILPRCAALSEVLWSDPSTRDYAGFVDRLSRLMDLYDRLGYRYSSDILCPVPSFSPDSLTHTVKVTYKAIDGYSVRYTTNGSKPGKRSKLYSGPVEVRSSCVLKAVAARKNRLSNTVETKFRLSKSTGCGVQVLTEAHRRYAQGGPKTLVDGIIGSEQYYSSPWLGYDGKDFVAIVDLGKVQPVSSAQIDICLNTNDWGFDARSIDILVSSDGQDFKSVFSEKYPPLEKKLPMNRISEHKLTFQPATARYVKFLIGCEMSLPSWMEPGAVGEPAFLFLDELSIN
jgi:hexosaminidase